MSFPISSSSLSNALVKTRFGYIQPLAMDLPVAVRVEEYPILHAV
jgi:hypothetical protein